MSKVFFLLLVVSLREGYSISLDSKNNLFRRIGNVSRKVVAGLKGVFSPSNAQNSRTDEELKAGIADFYDKVIIYSCNYYNYLLLFFVVIRNMVGRLGKISEVD